MNTIYLDHNATTPLHPEVFEAMRPVLQDGFGNPSSVHSLGRAARVKVDESREKVAELINARPGEIVFTSGGTESNNLAIKGIALALKKKGKHILTCEIEHPAVLNPCKQLAQLGFEVEYLPVDQTGRVDLEGLKQAIREQTILITIQHANSEVGTIQEIDTIAEIARERGVIFHTDAIQSVGKIPLDINKTPVDLLSLSAHKLYGPKGMGALYIHRDCPQLFPLLEGGGQEKKRRGGTENVAGIVGFGKACELARDKMESTSRSVEELRNHLYQLLRENISGVELFGDAQSRLPNTLNLGFEGVNGQSLMIGLDLEGIAVSTGSACSSGSVSPSHVLQAMQVPVEKINSSLRLSLGWNNTLQEMKTVTKKIKLIVERARRPVSI